MNAPGMDGRTVMGVVDDGQIGELLAMYQEESTQAPNSYIFLCLQSAGREEGAPILTGAVLIMTADTKERVDEMISNLPKHAVYFVFKDGDVVCTSEPLEPVDNFMANENVQANPELTAPGGSVRRINYLGHTLH